MPDDPILLLDPVWIYRDFGCGVAERKDSSDGQRAEVARLISAFLREWPLSIPASRG